MERVCLGLPEKHRRSLEEEERNYLEQQASRWGWSSAGVILGPMFLMLLLPLLSLALPDSLMGNTWFGQAWFVLFCVACLGWSVGIVMGLHYFQRYRALHHALKEGYIQRYEGIITQYHMREEAQYQLIQAGLLRIHPRAKQWVELLPGSHVLYRCNGVTPSRWMTLHVAIVATPPPSTFRVPLSNIMPQPQLVSPELERRHLNQDEQQELKLHIKTIRRPFWGMLSLVAISTSVMLIQFWNLYQQSERYVWHIIFVALLGGLSYLLGKRVFLVYQELHDMRRDLQMGWVICIPQEAPNPPTPSYVDLPALTELIESESERLVEILPISTTLWSVCGQRADWRTQSLI